ncbi:MAG TPA: hypothetical protein VIJ51_14420 [Solirubrobacteraceae bacterium]
MTGCVTGLTHTTTAGRMIGEHHHHGTVAKAFVGTDEIEAIVTAVGTVVSVTIFLTVDSGSTSFSVAR